MKVEAFEGNRERFLLTASVYNDSICSALASKWDGKLFSSPVSNRIAGWCVDHYQRYRSAPGNDLILRLKEWAENSSEDEVKLTDRLVSSIVDDHNSNDHPINRDLVIDILGKHINRVRLSRLKDDIGSYIESGKLEQAEAVVTSYRRLETGIGSGIDLFNDPVAMKSTFDIPYREPLISYPGDLGRFFGDALTRDSLVAFMGMEKIGKSWILLDVAMRAWKQRKKVAYFQVGDLSEWQIKERFLVHLLQWPSRSTKTEDPRWPCKLKIPVSISPPSNEDSAAEVKFEFRGFEHPLDKETDWEIKALEKASRQTKSKRSWFKLSCHSTKTVTVPMLRGIIDSWVQQEWIPDVVCVDYADILLPSTLKIDRLHQVKEVWEQLRKLSQELHCLVVTATQVNAASYTKRRLDRSNFSENHLKHAEVSAMYGINVGALDKAVQGMRLNTVMRRDGPYNPNSEIYVSGCLAIANPCMVSVLSDKSQKKKNPD